MPNTTSQLKCERGFSLVEIMIAVGVLAVLATAQMAMMSQQIESMRYLARKHEVLAVSNLIAAQLADPTVCTTNFENREFTAVASPGISPTKIKAKGDKLFIGRGAAKTAIAIEGKPLSKDSSSPVVDKIRLQNIVHIGPEMFKGDIVIEFETTLKKGDADVALKPIQLPVVINTTPGTPKTIETCGTSAPTSTLETCKIRTRYSTGDSMNTVCCNSQETIMAWAAPSDPKDSAFEWQTGNQNCGNIRDIKGGNPVQLLCCK